MKFNCPVFLSKDEVMILSEMAGPDLSITEYMRSVLIKHIASPNKAVEQTAKVCDCDDGVYPGSITYCVACGKDL